VVYLDDNGTATPTVNTMATATTASKQAYRSIAFAPCTSSTWYADADGDGYGSASATLSYCTQPFGYVSNSTDCDDADNTVNPLGTEVCGGTDEDCDGQLNEGLTFYNYYQDLDGDGLSNNTDSDDDGDGIADVSDKCPLQYGCASNPTGGATHGCPVNCVLNNSQTSNGTAIISAFTNCSAGSTGTLQLGTAVSGVTQTITATVTTAGTYNIIASANGVTFVGTGYVAAGTQNIVLTASGTPQASGTFTYTLNTSPNCSFTRSVTSSVSQSIGGHNWCWGSCNGGGQGGSDVFQTGYANVGSSFTLELSAF
jgi:hypothetical protein